MGACGFLGMARDPHLVGCHPAMHRIKSNCFPILVLMLTWFLLTVIALVFLFLSSMATGCVCPKQSGIYRLDAWMSVETVFAVAALAALVWFFVTPRNASACRIGSK